MTDAKEIQLDSYFRNKELIDYCSKNGNLFSSYSCNVLNKLAFCIKNRHKVTDEGTKYVCRDNILQTNIRDDLKYYVHDVSKSANLDPQKSVDIINDELDNLDDTLGVRGKRTDKISYSDLFTKFYNTGKFPHLSENEVEAIKNKKLPDPLPKNIAQKNDNNINVSTKFANLLNMSYWKTYVYGPTQNTSVSKHEGQDQEEKDKYNGRED